MGYVYARLIYKGIKKLSEVPAKYYEATRKAYKELYGETI